jgi:ABC-type sugar transport system substrate-binding protein
MRPSDPRSLPETDPRYWYDEEFAGWMAVKHGLPPSPSTGPEGKRLFVFCQGHHPYWLEYEKGLRKEAEKYGFLPEMHFADWDQETQSAAFLKALEKRPDMIIISPVEPAGGAECVRSAHSAGIPVIASNQALQNDIYSLVVAWSGPDDWGQHRLLARHFAQVVGRPGGYCLITHQPGTSVYLARTWAVITELASIAPELRLLDMRFTGFNREITRKTVDEWITKFGDDIVGIISADDSLPQEGINRAIAERGREDIVRVANGATRRGLGFIKSGTLAAATWQPPELDGALPVRLSADWFRGLKVEPITYLPSCIITPENVESFLQEGLGFEDFHGEDLSRMILEGSLEEIKGFFEDLKGRLETERFVGEEYFGGFAIELLSEILNLAKTRGIDPLSLSGGYEMLYKGIFQQETVSKALDWLLSLAVKTVQGLTDTHQLSGILIDRLYAYTSLHYAEPLALKTLSYHFGLSAAYLGKVFKESSGLSFSNISTS